MKGLRDVHTQSVLKREEVQAQEQSNSQVIDALRQYPSPPHTSSAWDHGTGRRRRRPGQHSTRRVLFAVPLARSERQFPCRETLAV